VRRLEISQEVKCLLSVKEEEKVKKIHHYYKQHKTTQKDNKQPSEEYKEFNKCDFDIIIVSY
jgi:hypothetical protein